MNCNYSLVSTFLGLAFLGMVTGCAEKSPNVKVTGTVTVDGQPVEQGGVTFLSENNDGPSGGGVINNGKYEATVPPGKKIVMVLGNKVVGERLRLEGVPDSGSVPKLETMTHPLYNTREHSPLRADITKETADLNFNLSADGKGK